MHNVAINHNHSEILPNRLFPLTTESSIKGECITYCVVCIMYCVLCIMYYVLCITYYVLCIMYYVLCMYVKKKAPIHKMKFS